MGTSPQKVGSEFLPITRAEAALGISIHGFKLGWILKNGNPILLLDLFCHKIHGIIIIGSQKSVG